MEINAFGSFTLAIVLLFLGKAILERSPMLQRYSVPEAVVGGFIAAGIIGLIFALFSYKVTFDLGAQDYLLLYFFAGIGLKADIRDLWTGGKALFLLIGLVAIYIVIQNLLGMLVAALFGFDAKLGLMVGSVSLTGGMGTTFAWGPTFTQDLGIANAVEVGIAASTIGLIAACMIGGPIANILIKRYGLTGSGDDDLDVGQRHDKQHKMIDSYCVLWSWMWLNFALILGNILDMGLELIHVNMPLFVSCLIAGILLSNGGRWLFPNKSLTGEKQSLALISDISLGMFLVMALMGMQLWELKGAVVFLLTVMSLQVLVAGLFAGIVVFRLLGKNYEAAVIASGFTGLNLGTTATALVSMTAVTKQHGAAHRAFLLVPIVGGFFIGVINAVVISFLVWI